MKLGDAITIFLVSMKGVRSPETIGWYKRRLESLAGVVGRNKDLEQVTVIDLRLWRAYLSDRSTRYDNHPIKPQEPGGLSSWTLYSYVRCARSFFKWLHSEGMAEMNVAERLELPKRERIPRKGVADDVADKIIAEAHNSGSARDYALVMFIADTAARRGGAVELRLEDLDLKAGRATVREKGCGGHGLGRTVFLGPETVTAMTSWLAVRPNVADDHVFLGRFDKPLRETGVYQVFRRYAKRAGISGYGWNPHNWRHAAARSMLKNGASLAHVSQILGHSDVEVTCRFYGSFSVDELETAHQKYSRFTNTKGD